MKIKPKASSIDHLQSDSHRPIFDARLRDNDENGYINPFTGEIGSKKVGTHLPLEKNTSN
ncbi:MAG: hypothetical protein HC850_10300 [Rhodomicrobium sp.]|nr:hypothetical protein [Rhodomicrobium sp.]